MTMRPSLRKRQAIPPTLTSIGYMSGARTLAAGPADALTGLARYREVYIRARQRWGVRVSLRHVLYAYRYGVVLSGLSQGMREQQFVDMDRSAKRGAE